MLYIFEMCSFSFTSHHYQALPSLKPVKASGEAEDVGEAEGGLLVAAGDRVPLLEAHPQPLDDGAVQAS